ncbi:MAG TPA: hypothetical protein VNP93_14425 [Gaiellaceae bacterium]|nr:hypothetical protein [Gaiellaceae bacterium]
MEAARIPWRPLGRLLVEQGLLTADELEHALAQQERTGRRLGETLVECGFVSGPELSNALAAQYGIELTAETGFGTGLRTVIQQRHETDRGRALRAVPSTDEPHERSSEAQAQPEEPELEAPPPGEQLLHAQLEEQWAKLAAAEERLAESHRELTALAREYDRRRSQAERFVHRVRERDVRVERLAADVQGCDAEIGRLRDETERAGRALAAAEASAVERDRLLDELRRESERRRAQAARFLARLRNAAPEPAPAPPPEGHVVFVQLADRYELVEREGPPPPRNAVLELPELCDVAVVVAGLGSSPLPGDARPCVFVQPGA